MERAAQRRAGGVGDLARGQVARQPSGSGSGSGIAASSALVYGCLGSAKISSVAPISTIRPRYMIAIRSQKNFALARSWVM